MHPGSSCRLVVDEYYDVERRARIQNIGLEISMFDWLSTVFRGTTIKQTIMHMIRD
jgi:hypothetical protein